MASLRAAAILIGIFALTAVLILPQALLVAFAPTLAQKGAAFYHRSVRRLMGIRLKVSGQFVDDAPSLLISNHISWLDIIVLGSIGPFSFIAKKEVGTWPLVGVLAKLQRTIFVDRERRTTVKGTTDEIAQRLSQGERILLFAEGTSSDGNQVLPFKTSLFAAAESARHANPNGGGEGKKPVYVQTLALAYTRIHGIPLGRSRRPLVAWYGDMDMADHAWTLLKSGPLDAEVALGEPVLLAHFADRKVLARHTEARVRADLAQLLTGRP